MDQNDVLKLNAATHVLTLVAGNGTAGFSGDNGLATSAVLSGPQGVAVDAESLVQTESHGRAFFLRDHKPPLILDDARRIVHLGFQLETPRGASADPLTRGSPGFFYIGERARRFIAQAPKIG